MPGFELFNPGEFILRNVQFFWTDKLAPASRKGNVNQIEFRFLDKNWLFQFWVFPFVFLNTGLYVKKIIRKKNRIILLPFCLMDGA